MKLIHILTLALLVGLSSGAGRPKLKSCTPEMKDQHRHLQFLKDRDAALKTGPIELVFIGDSITDFWRQGKQLELFKERWGKFNPYNIGVNADQTQHVLWRLENGEIDRIKPKLAIIMIGTNNLGIGGASPAEASQGIACVVAEVKDRLPKTSILLLGVFPRVAKPPQDFPAMIREVNKAIATLDNPKRKIRFLDIGEKFLDKDGKIPADVMKDGLHPTSKGYQIWADAIQPAIDDMMK